MKSDWLIGGLFALGLAGLVLLSSKLPKREWRWYPHGKDGNTNKNDDFAVRLTATNRRSFLLTVANKSDTPLEIDWDKTRYLSGGRTDKGFDRKGVDIVLPNSTGHWTIYPETLAKEEQLHHEYFDPKKNRWNPPVYRTTHGKMSGIHGVYLSLKRGETVISSTLQLEWIEEEINR